MLLLPIRGILPEIAPILHVSVLREPITSLLIAVVLLAAGHDTPVVSAGGGQMSDVL